MHGILRKHTASSCTHRSICSSHCGSCMCCSQIDFQELVQGRCSPRRATSCPCSFLSCLFCLVVFTFGSYLLWAAFGIVVGIVFGMWYRMCSAFGLVFGTVISLVCCTVLLLGFALGIVSLSSAFLGSTVPPSWELGKLNRTHWEALAKFLRRLQGFSRGVSWEAPGGVAEML